MSGKDPKNILAKLVEPTQGVETRDFVQRKGEVGFYKAQQLVRYENQDSDGSSSLKERTARVRFSDPEVTESVSPVYYDAVSPEARLLPKITLTTPTKGLKQKFGSLTNLLFRPRQTPPARDPSPGRTLTWDHFTDSTPDLPSASSDRDDSSILSPIFSPAHRRGLTLRGRPASPAPVFRLPDPPPARLVFDITDNDNADIEFGQLDMLRRAQVNDPPNPQHQPALRFDAPAVLPPAGQQAALQPAPQAGPVNQPAPLPPPHLAVPADHPAPQPVVPAVQPAPQADPAGQQADPANLPAPLPAAPAGQPAALPAVLDDDDDERPYAMSSALIPAPFKGMFNEDSREWFETASWYVQTQRTPTEKSKIALVGILLLDDAKRWFLGLRIENANPDGGQAADGVITTFAQFRDAFLLRFQQDQANLWREQALIWQCKQKSGQNTQNYLNELQELGSRARATQPQILTAAIAGLRQDVKTFCLSHELATLQDLQRWANVYEMCSAPTAADTTIERLEKVLEKLQVRAASPAPRSASPARPSVRFADRPASPDGQREDSRRTAAAPFGQQAGTYGGGATGGSWGYGGERGAWRGRGQSARGGYGPRYGRYSGQPGRFRQFEAPTNFQTPPRQFQDQGRGFRPQTYYRREDNEVVNQVCGSCGRAHDFGRCFARGSICRICQKPNHWSSMCRSGRPRQQL